MNRPGIYRIVNEVSGRTYIGSSINVRARILIHIRNLNLGIHRNRHLQSSWLKHGEWSFSFEPLLFCDQANLVSREQQFIDAYFENEIPLYNKKPSFESRLGFRYEASDDTRSKLSLAHKGKPKPPHIVEQLRMRLKGKPKTLEHRQKLRLAQSGKVLSPEHRKAIGMAGKGRITSEETKQRMSMAQRLRLQSPEARSRMVGMKGKHHSEATREKLRIAAMKRWKIS